MNNKKGFTLIEIIFSVAFLSIVSVIMLQLLTSAHGIEKDTDLLEVATLYAMNEIELVKGQTAVPQDLETIKYYDENWSEKDDQARYEIKRMLIKDEAYNRLYFVRVIVTEGEEELVDIETKHFFIDKE